MPLYIINFLLNFIFTVAKIQAKMLNKELERGKNQIIWKKDQILIA